MKNKVIRTILSLGLIFSLAMFSGCTHSDDENSPMIGNIAGIKASYRPEEYPITDYYEAFSKQILVELSTVFGLASFPTNEDDQIDFIAEQYDDLYGQMQPSDPNYLTYEQYEDNVRIFFLDDIRNSVYVFNQTNNTYYAYTDNTYKWKWTIGDVNDYQKITTSDYFQRTFFNGFQANDYTPFDTFDMISGNLALERTNFYNNYYANKYASSLQVAILEMLLGKTPTQFSYNFATNAITPSATALLEGDNGLKAQYARETTYLGIAEQDITKITNYILDYVIGSQKFSTTNLSNHFSRVNYQNIIEKVIWQNKLAEFYFSDLTPNNPLLGSIYDTYPALVVKDYASNAFFISSRDGHAFDHIPSGEYQSIILMPSQMDYLSEIWFYLASERLLTINYHYRYYDATTDTYYVSSTTKTNTLIESQFLEEESSYSTILFKNASGKEILYQTKPFNNSIGDGALLALGIERTLSKESSEFFKTIPSVNGFGSVAVLNEQKFKQDNSSYFEIVFDVEKDPAHLDADYSFKVGMYSLWFASQSMIDDYLWEQQNS